MPLEQGIIGNNEVSRLRVFFFLIERGGRFCEKRFSEMKPGNILNRNFSSIQKKQIDKDQPSRT